MGNVISLFLNELKDELLRFGLTAGVEGKTDQNHLKVHYNNLMVIKVCIALSRYLERRKSFTLAIILSCKKLDLTAFVHLKRAVKNHSQIY